MTPALLYAGRRVTYRLVEFFRHWYVKSARIYSNFVLDRLARLDYVFAWKITARHLFDPLYRDYSIVGYVLGFFFRGARLIVASVIYGGLFAAALGGYVAWLLIPPFLLVLAFAPLII